MVREIRTIQTHHASRNIMSNPNRYDPRTIPHSLNKKLFLAFAGMALLGVLLVIFGVAGIVFQRYNELVGARTRSAFIQDVTTYYSDNETWNGVEDLSRTTTLTILGEAFLLDSNGDVLIGDNLETREWWQEQIQLDTPIIIEGETVGRVVAEPLGRDFLSRIRDALILSLVVAGFLIAWLASFVSRTLTDPLKELRDAAETVAQGQRAEPLHVRTQDEVGNLAHSFNRMNAELDHSRELRETMTADIAHELRTPLGLILGHAEALKDGILPPKPETFELIHDEAARLNRLVDDLRTISLADQGKLSLHHAPTDIRTIFKQAFSAYKPMADQKNVTISWNVQDDVPPISADPDRIRQVVDNLLANALRYTAEGGTIQMLAETAGSMVKFQGIDSGIGIPPELLPYIFDRFYRPDASRNREKGGSGLGLAIAKSIIDQHNGEITVESEEGVGTTFTILLPIKNLRGS